MRASDRAKLIEDIRRAVLDQAYELVGQAYDLTTEIGVVARFAGPLLIITVYEKKR